MADDLHGRHVLVFDGQLHVDGVLADRAVLAVDRIIAIRVVAGVLLAGRRGIRVIGMVFGGGVAAGRIVSRLAVGFRLIFLRLHAFAGIAGVFVVHRRGFRLAACRQQRDARRG